MDRLSSLPDEILCHIMYFLTTKEAALTSVLSKRWRNLFAFVPNLDLDDSVFLHPEEGKREMDGILQSFMDFVDRVLALQGDSPIKKLSLKVKTGADPDRVDHWICNVLQRGVSHLDLSMKFGEEYSLPCEISVSKTLVELKIGRIIDLFSWDDDMFLPMLKTLVLDSIIVSLEGQIQMLLPACPALEELYMINTRWTDSDVTVSSPVLKKLTIKLKGSSELIILKSLSLDAPSLVSFHYADTLAEDYPKVNLKNLYSAIINLLVPEDQIKQARAPNNDLLEDDIFPGLGNAWKLISGLKNVHKLLLTSDIFEVLSLRSESIPVFNNLRILAVRSDMNRGWQAMPVLLRNCPHLDFLIFEGLLHYVMDKCGDACVCISQKEKGRSLKSCPMKKTLIRGFQGTMREIEMIRHFLDSFPCLKEMKIYAEENSPSLFKYPGMLELFEKIMNLYNDLSSCNVQFLVHGSL